MTKETLVLLIIYYYFPFLNNIDDKRFLLCQTSETRILYMLLQISKGMIQLYTIHVFLL